MELARVLVYGDIHLLDKNYGAHRDYAVESLHYFKEITRIAEEKKATHLIGLGDFTYGRFSKLEYRLAVEEELMRQNRLVEGRRYELKGNHDVSSKGMTEYEYYIEKGLLKGSTNLRIGDINISMVDYGKHKEWEILDPLEEGTTNIVLAHDYYKFDDANLPDFGRAIRLEEMDKWFGVNHLVCGHIHNQYLFEGSIVRGNRAKRMSVQYLGALTRPAYQPGFMDEVGNLLMLTIYDNGELKYEIIDVDLWSIEDTYNIEKKEEDLVNKLRKKNRVDISDVVSELERHERNIGDPVVIIENMSGVDKRYKDKAVELLMEGLK